MGVYIHINLDCTKRGNNAKEIWKNVEGFKGIIKVSNLGNINIIKIKHKVINSNGYECVKIRNRHLYIHRMVADAFLTKPDTKVEVNHIDGIKTNNVCSNLEWISHKSNIEHAYKNCLFKSKKRTKFKLKLKEMASEVKASYEKQHDCFRIS